MEGSNDRVNWTVIDSRDYRPTGDARIDASTKEERNLLCQQAAASTWAVDLGVYNEIGNEGFRYFRIIQTGKNSSGSHNLALSGLELYGQVVSGEWP